MKKRIILLGACLAVMTLTISSCKKKEDSPAVTPAPAPTLYERVGGTTMVMDPTSTTSQKIEQGRLTLRSVVDSTIFVIAGDAQLKPYFGKLLAEVGAKDYSGFEALSKNLTDFLCSATGSKTILYTGDPMAAAHDPTKNSRMGQTANSADFDKFVGDVGTGLAQNKVTDKQLIADLVALLYTQKAAIVQR
jgi:hypothetical protein